MPAKLSYWQRVCGTSLAFILAMSWRYRLSFFILFILTISWWYQLSFHTGDELGIPTVRHCFNNVDQLEKHLILINSLNSNWLEISESIDEPKK